MVVLQVVAVVAGVALVVVTLFSALKTVVLPRAESSLIVRAEWITLSRIFDLVAHERRSYEARDRILAFYAPIALLLLPGLWVALIIVAYTLIYWGTGLEPLREAFIVSGSSMLTLGFDRPPGLGHIVLSFTEATIGLGIVALMISYLPSLYGAFNRREVLVGMLEARAGSPPTVGAWLARYHIIGLLPAIESDFTLWETWFADLEESHTSNPSLVFFRSPEPDRNWLTAAGCVLDTAAVVASTIDRPPSARAQIMIRTGYVSLRRIATYFGIEFDPDPRPDDPISVSRREFDLLLVELRAADVPLKRDLDQAWRDWAGWRVNYDRALVALAGLIVAPRARWSSDRQEAGHIKPKVHRPSPLRVSRTRQR
ncbi:MAG TPA: hypothetical protein VKD67_07310 [Acidimicrobiales bacterium]|nr:hypothetical protein [Acidimicrobiales bacterium]